MSCIGCKNFYYRSDGSGCCDMPYKEACLKNNFQFKENYPRGLRATTSGIDDFLVENKNILDRRNSTSFILTFYLIYYII